MKAKMDQNKQINGTMGSHTISTHVKPSKGVGWTHDMEGKREKCFSEEMAVELRCHMGSNPLCITRE